MTAGSEAWTQTTSAGSALWYWTSPTIPWSAISRHTAVSARISGRLAPRRQANSHSSTEDTPSAVAMWPWRRTSVFSVDAPNASSRSTTSPVPAPPACGPAAVANVPATITTAP